MDAPAVAVSGLTPAAKALFVAAAAQALPHGAVLYVVPGDADLEDAAADLRFFLAALEGGASTGVFSFPSHEVDPYRGMAPHVGVTSARAGALHALATGTARIIVASAAALLPRVSAPTRLLGMSLEIKPGDEVSPTDLVELLVDAGFTREDPADEHGEFALRGGILDIYPPRAAQPVRLEFIGDTVESLRTYDPATQRSTKPIDQLTVVPLRDALPGDDSRSATLFDYLARVKETRTIVSEPDEVEAAGREADRTARAESFAETSTKLPAPSALFLDWAGVSARLEHAYQPSPNSRSIRRRSGPGHSKPADRGAARPVSPDCGG